MSRIDSLEGISVIVPAAGLGTRMQAATPKQYIEVRGKTILEHTLTRILQLRPERVVLVVSAEDRLARSLPVVERCEIVIGGIQRIDSVLCGLLTLNVDADDWIMVHDAVRPCVRTQDILNLCREVSNHEIGGLLGIPVTDTVKHVDGNLIVASIDRSQLWHAQTPQLFRFRVLLEALQKAALAGATDESEAIEQLGHQPMMVQGHSDNIKITTQDDLRIADFYLSNKGLSNEGQPE